MDEPAIAEITFVYELIWKFLHSLERPLVKFQVFGIVISLALGWLISQGIWIQWKRRFPMINDWKLTSNQPSLKQVATDLLRFLLTPVLCLMAVHFLQTVFVQRGLRAGLITVALKILWTFFFYRSFLLICFKIFPSAAVKRYRYQFFTPLFLLFVFNTILSLLTNIDKLSQVVVVRLFDTPVTLGTIFIITVGLYFWIIGVSIFERLFLYVFFLVNNQKTGSAQATSIIIRYCLIGLGIILFLGYVGFGHTTLAAISGGLSVGIGFSLKEILGNFLSGIGLLFEGSLRPGDMIEVDGEVASVEQISVRATRVTTFDNIEKIVPNQYLFTSIVTTYTGNDSIVRVLVPVGVSYNCDPEKVMGILLKVAQQNEQVQSNPKPSVQLMGYGDSSVDFRLAVFINNPAVRLTVRSDLYRAIWKELAANNIEIPFPQRDLHIRSDSTKS